MTAEGTLEEGEEEVLTNDDFVEPSLSSGGARRAHRRGRRCGVKAPDGKPGSARSSPRTKQKIKRWRSGQVPYPPTFDPDIENDPFCLRHYRAKLRRWVRITREFLPANEQALRAREALKGEAELELEEIPDDRYDQVDGIDKLLADLETSFGEKELFRQGGVIREFESVGRMQGESVTAFVRRFRLLERKLQDNRVPAYPEEARVIKLLDGLCLDERAAGNKYNMAAVQEAIKIQYPAAMSITGLPLPSGSARRRGKAAPVVRNGRPSRGRWNNWHTAGLEDDDNNDLGDIPEKYEAPVEDAAEAEDGMIYAYDEEDDPEGSNGAYAGGDGAVVAETADGPPDNGEPTWNALVGALTVTSRRLAELTQSRGYYNSGGKKGRGRGKGGKNKSSSKGFPPNKGSGKCKPTTSSSSPSSAMPAKGKGAGKPSPTVTKASLAEQQQGLKDATCLGCGSAGHWLRDCPVVTRHAAQLTTAGHVLDAQGQVLENWMVTASAENEARF